MLLSKAALFTRRLASRHVTGMGSLTTKRRLSLAADRQAGMSSTLRGLEDILKISEEVKDALATNKPVVALESTIYTHGALGDLGLEDIVRRNGAVPAVCGILAGIPTVGLSPEEIDRMVNEKALKASRRDIASLAGKALIGIKEHGGTTISGTMVLARLAGIRVFGTGGLGGVHRGAESSMDVSADLTELGRTRMAVVASGCKGFLDIQRTLEFLETHGVVVSTFLRGRDASEVSFPGFWATDSGLKSPSTVRHEEEAAAIILAQEKLGIESGIVFANPIPKDDSIPKAEMDAIIEQAVTESMRQAATGNENTPFILKRIRELSEGRSVTANTSLVQSNVKCAAKIAVALSYMSGKDGFISRCQPMPSLKSLPPLPETLAQADILVAGSVAVDLTCDHRGAAADDNADPQLYTSNPAIISQTIGGVGRNVAVAAHKLGTCSGVRFCSLVGADMAGGSVIDSLSSLGMDVSCIRKLDTAFGPSARTAEYVAINGSKKDLFLAMADMNIFSYNTFPEDWDRIVAQSKPKWLVVDANWSSSGIASWIKAAKQQHSKVAFEPVSRAKSERLFWPPTSSTCSLGVFPDQSIELSTPNQYELNSMCKSASTRGYFDCVQWSKVYEELNQTNVHSRLMDMASDNRLDPETLLEALKLLPYIPTLVTKLGSKGAVMLRLLPKNDNLLLDPVQSRFISKAPATTYGKVGGIYLRFYPAVQDIDDVVSVNGVGDTFLGVLVAGLASGGRTENLIDVAQRGAVMTLRSPESVSPTLGTLKSDLLALSAGNTD